MKLAANLSLLFTEMTLVTRVLAARVAGFQGVEIQFPYEVPAVQMKEALERAGLPLVLMNLPAGDLLSGGAGLAAVPDAQAKFDAALQHALAYAAMTRPLGVNVLAGRLAEGVEREQAMDTLVANLRKVAESFQMLQIPVFCEAINPLDMPGFLINTPADLMVLLDRVSHPNCMAQLDLYHMARQGLNPQEAILDLWGCIGHVQFADYPGRGAPGTGQLDFDGLLERLQQVGYQGWVGAEFHPGQEGTEAYLGWMSKWLAKDCFKVA